MRVHLDRDRCQGHNRCLSPDITVIDCDELGYAVVCGNGSVPHDEQEAVELAVANCPERALTITITEERT